MSAILPRLAIGASWTPMAVNATNGFDGSGILPLCYGDPSNDPSQPAPLVKVGFADSVEPIFDIREVAVPDAPRQLRRTGYGSRLAFALELIYETVSQGPDDFPGDPTDNALFSLVSLSGMTAAGSALTPVSGLTPPYLYLTTTFQTPYQQWIPIEIDPQASGSDWNHDFPLTKTWLRRIQIRFVSQKVWQRIGIRYRPAMIVRRNGGATWGVPSGGQYTITLNVALPAEVIPGYWLLARVGGDYSWYLFEIVSIAGNRLSAVAIAKDLATPSPVTNAVPVRTMVPDTYLRMPDYALSPYPGGPALTTAFKALPTTAKAL